MKKLFAFIAVLLLTVCLAGLVQAQSPTTGDVRWNWRIEKDSIGVVSTAADTSSTFTCAWYKVAEMVWYMRKIGVLGGDSLQIQAYIEYSMDGVAGTWKALDSIDASGATASADSSVWQVKTLSTNIGLFPYFRVRTAGLTDNDKSGGTSLKWNIFLKE